MQLRIGSLLLIVFSLFGTVFLIPPSYAGGVPSFGASECNVPGQEDDFNADIESGESSWIIPNHEISLDPNAGPWKKNLLPVGGSGSVPVDDSTTQGTPQTFFDVTETITVGPNGGSFTDWHEEIVNPGWIWEFSDVTTNPPDSSIVTVMGDETNSVTIFFDPPLPHGTEFLIEKSLVFVGSDGNFDTGDITEISVDSPIVLQQFPTVGDSPNNYCDGDVVPGTIQEQIDSLKILVNDSVDDKKDSKKLTKKLDNSLKELGNDKADRACKEMNGFIKDTNNLVKKKKLEQAYADTLIGSAQEIKSSIGCA